MPANFSRRTLMDERYSYRKPGHAALRNGRASICNTAYLITTTTQNREPLFSHFPAACSAARCFEDAALLRGSRMLAWVLMPDHAHWLVQLGEADNLGDVIGRLKSASSRHTNRTLNRMGSRGRKPFTIMPCAKRTICKPSPVISWPIRCERGWSSGSGIIRSGMPSGFDPDR